MDVAGLVRAGEGHSLGIGHGYLAESYCFNPRLFDPTRGDHVVPVFEQVARTLVSHTRRRRKSAREDGSKSTTVVFLATSGLDAD